MSNRWSSFGFTTGMAAAAALTAAAKFAQTGRCSRTVLVETPDGGGCLEIDVDKTWGDSGSAGARVIKEAGPDRDITDKIPIEVNLTAEKGGSAMITGGPGVGIVTEPGLSISVGSAAINPVPLAHLKELALAAFPGGVKVVVAAEGGEKLAKQTFNERLGIIGGISILGTTGLVRPMSLPSMRQALVLQLSRAAALGFKRVALTFGNIGEKAAVANGYERRQVAQMGNFAGFMTKEAAARFNDIMLIGHIGKIVKIAAGFSNTHHQATPDRIALLAEVLAGHSTRLAETIKGCLSADAAIGVIEENAPGFLNELSSMAAEHIGRWVPGGVDIAVMTTDINGRIVGTGALKNRGCER